MAFMSRCITKLMAYALCLGAGEPTPDIPMDDTQWQINCVYAGKAE